jgi:deazaflavin-dependent oxidoreductase (nitroreductase family)
MSVATTASRPRPHPLVFRVVSFFNRAVLFLAGTPLMPLWAVITHRGRRSGKVFRTPVVVRAVNGGFVVPMPWGETTDWCRNIRAAGGCTVRWKGRDFQMSNPEVMDAPAVSAAFSPWQAQGMRRFNIQQCLLLRHANAA